MTTKTTLDQNCTSIYDALGSTRFQVANNLSYVAPGDLPSQAVFVFQLGTAADPKTDAFLRIGSIQDITTMVIGRDNAISTQQLTYLATGFTVVYSDVATATAAKQLIQSRLEQLITDWQTYNTSFASSSTTYPLQDASLVTAKKDAYVAARTAKTAADAAAATAAAAVTAAQTVSANAAATQALKQSIYSDCTSTQTIVSGLVTGEAAFRAAAQAFLTAVNSSAATISSAQLAAIAFSNAIAAETTNLQMPLQALSASFTTKCAQKQTDLNAASTARVVADTAINTAQRTAILTQQTAATAQTTLEGALADAVAVCPTFDPASV